MTHHPIDEHELHAYVDGALAPERRIVIEAHLAANPDAARRVDAYRRQNALSRLALDPLLDEPVPARLRVRPAGRHTSSLLRTAGLAASLLFAGALGWFLRGEPVSPALSFEPDFARHAVRAHLVYTPEVLHPVEVTANQEQHLVGWLSKRLGANVRAPDLQPAGFHLVGGRLLPGERRPAAQFMYEDANGGRLTLYVAVNTDDQRETAFRYAEDRGVGTFYWIDGPLGYALSGGFAREQLLHAAESVYRDLAQ